MMKFMSDATLTTTDAPVATKSAREKAVEAARDHLTRYAGRAVEILTELAETSENDRVRLAAADSILDRAGVGKSSTQQVNVSQSEQDAATREAQALVDSITRNKQHARITPGGISIDALIVHEGTEATHSV